MKLYSGPLSLFSAKSRIALAEKGLEHRLIQVGWSRENRYLPHHPDVVRLNPQCKVPILVDGDVVVCDSTLIAEYLEDRYPDPPLFPDSIKERARCRQQEAAADEIWFPHIWDLIETGFYPNDGDGDASDRSAAAQQALAELYEQLDRELEGRDFYCDRFTVADIATAVFVNAAATLGAPPPGTLSNVHAWVDRIQKRPSVASVNKEMGDAAASALAA